MKASIFLLLMSICLESLGGVVIIKGQPTPLEYRHELYYLPANFPLNNRSTFYATVDSIEKICFQENSNTGMFESISEINLVINGVVTEWNCFPYKTTIFAVRP